MSSPRRINPIAAEVQFIPLQAGFYLATLRSTGRAPQAIGHFTVPSAQIAGLHPPAGKGEPIEIMSGGGREGWLQQRGDQVVFRVPPSGGQILITTYRAQGAAQSNLDIAILPLSALLDQAAAGAGPQAQTPGPQAERPVQPRAAAPRAIESQPVSGVLELLAHNAMLGDRRGATDVWVGDTQARQQMEGFAVTAVDPRFPADGLTYRAGFANRRETRWMPLGSYCGTRGQGLGMVGIALKLSPALQQRGLDVEYAVVGRRCGAVPPVRNGATCRVPDGDVIVCIKVRLIRRIAAAASPGAPRQAPQPPQGGPAQRPSDLGAWL